MNIHSLNDKLLLYDFILNVDMSEILLQDIFSKNQKYTFLVGAGCSIDSPSCLPAGVQMMDVLIKFSCNKSEVNKILSLGTLRFEQLVEILRDTLDPELKIIDYYGLCDKPNKIHLFLAEMMKRGHYVITTNFDYLIEYALVQSGIKRKKIIPVITKPDFKESSNPEELFRKKRFPVYKIHGSCKNIISGKSTKDSLIATIQAFGSGKEGESVFQLEPHKRPLFDHISKNRSLVVLGYSGSDDFDIVPTLKHLEHLDQIVWIDHAPLGTKTEISEISVKEISENDDKVGEILHEIQRMGYGKPIYRIKINTQDWIKNVFKLNLQATGKPFSALPMEYMQGNVRIPNILEQFEIPFKIYKKLSLLQDAYRCASIYIAKLRTEQNFNEQTIFPKIVLLAKEAEMLTEKGIIHLEFGEMKKAEEIFYDALEISEEVEVSSKVFENIGQYFLAKGDGKKALEFLNKSLNLDEKPGNLRNKSITLQKLGNIARQQWNLNEAMKYFQISLTISEKTGDLSMRANSLYEIGKSQKFMGDYANAIVNFKKSLQISEELGDILLKAENLINLGQINEKRMPFDIVMDLYKQVSDISEQLRNPKLRAESMINIGRLYELVGGERQGIGYYKKALKIAEELPDLDMRTRCYILIGEIYEKRQKNLKEALSYYKTAKSYSDKLDNKRIQSNSLRHMGKILLQQEDFDESITQLQNSLIIAEKIRDKVLIYEVMQEMGDFWHKKGDLLKAHEFFLKSLTVCKETGNILDEMMILKSISSLYFHNKEFEKLILILNEALAIAEKLEHLVMQSEFLEVIAGVYHEQNRQVEELKYAEACLKTLARINSWKLKSYEDYVERLKYKLKK